MATSSGGESEWERAQIERLNRMFEVMQTMTAQEIIETLWSDQLLRQQLRQFGAGGDGLARTLQRAQAKRARRDGGFGEFLRRTLDV